MSTPAADDGTARAVATYDEISTTLLEATHELVGIVVEEAMVQTSAPPFYSKEEFAGLSDDVRTDCCEEFGLPATATYDAFVEQYTLVTSAQGFMETGQLISEEKWGLLTDASKLQFVGDQGPFSDSDGYTTVVEKLAGVGVPSYVQLKAAFDEAASAVSNDPDAPPTPAVRTAELHDTVARALGALQAQLDADLAMLAQTQDGDQIFMTITEVGQMRLMWQAQVTQYTQLGRQYANESRGVMALPPGMGMGMAPPPLPPGIGMAPPPLPPGIGMAPPPLPPGIGMAPPPLPPGIGMDGGRGMPPPPMGYMDPAVTYGAVIETGKAICTQCDVFLEKVGKMSSSS